MTKRHASLRKSGAGGGAAFICRSCIRLDASIYGLPELQERPTKYPHIVPQLRSRLLLRYQNSDYTGFCARDELCKGVAAAPLDVATCRKDRTSSEIPKPQPTPTPPPPPQRRHRNKLPPSPSPLTWTSVSARRACATHSDLMSSSPRCCQ